MVRFLSSLGLSFLLANTTVPRCSTASESFLPACLLASLPAHVHALPPGYSSRGRPRHTCLQVGTSLHLVTRLLVQLDTACRGTMIMTIKRRGGYYAAQHAAWTFKWSSRDPGLHIPVFA